MSSSMPSTPFLPLESPPDLASVYENVTNQLPFPSNLPPEAPTGLPITPSPHNGLGKTGVGLFRSECDGRQSCHEFDSPELPGPPYVLLSGGRGLLKIEGGHCQPVPVL